MLLYPADKNSGMGQHHADLLLGWRVSATVAILLLLVGHRVASQNFQLR